MKRLVKQCLKLSNIEGDVQTSSFLYPLTYICLTCIIINIGGEKMKVRLVTNLENSTKRKLKILAALAEVDMNIILEKLIEAEFKKSKLSEVR